MNFRIKTKYSKFLLFVAAGFIAVYLRFYLNAYLVAPLFADLHIAGTFGRHFDVSTLFGLTVFRILLDASAMLSILLGSVLLSLLTREEGYYLFLVFIGAYITFDWVGLFFGYYIKYHPAITVPDVTAFVLTTAIRVLVGIAGWSAVKMMKQRLSGRY